MTTVTLIGVGFGVVGLVFLALGIGIARSTIRFRRRAERARGTIVALRMRRTSSSTPSLSSGGDATVSPPTLSGGGGGGRVYLPTVAFTTAEGREIRSESSFGSNPPPGRVGDSVGVLYDPARPERFRVDTLLGRGGCLWVALVVLAVGMLAISAIMLDIAGS